MDIPNPILCDGKFTGDDVADLRSDLVQSGLDSWQAAELISSFLATRGYGISAVSARDALMKMDASHSSLEKVHRELEKLALVM